MKEKLAVATTKNEIKEKISAILVKKAKEAAKDILEVAKKLADDVLSK